jgi:hypothetical protein
MTEPRPHHNRGRHTNAAPKATVGRLWVQAAAGHTVLHACLIATLIACQAAVRRARGSENGEIAVYLAWAALGVMTTAVLWSLMQALGEDVIKMIHETLLGQS